MLGTSRTAADAVSRAATLRAAAIRAVRRRGLYLTDLRVAIHKLRRAGSALRSAGQPETALDRANTDYLRRALDLELALLVSIRDSWINEAEAAYRELVTLHRTQEATADAVAALPANVRSGTGQGRGTVEPVAFGLPISVLADYLQPAMPPLESCRHGRLSADGGCSAPPCPPDA